MTACHKSAPPVRPLAEVGTVTLRTERAVLTTELPGRTSAFLVAEIDPAADFVGVQTPERKPEEDGVRPEVGKRLDEFGPVLEEEDPEIGFGQNGLDGFLNGDAGVGDDNPVGHVLPLS